MKKILLAVILFMSLKGYSQKYHVVAYYTGDSTRLMQYDLSTVSIVADVEYTTTCWSEKQEWE